MFKLFARSALMGWAVIALALASVTTPAKAECTFISLFTHDCGVTQQATAAVPQAEKAAFKYNLRDLRFQPHYVEGRTKAVDRSNPVECLTDAMLGEAGSQTDEQKRLIADVKKNRQMDGEFPTTDCGVIYQWHKATSQDAKGSFVYDNCQFTFACEPRTYKAAEWAKAEAIAREELSRHGLSDPRMVGVVNYHAEYVHPHWTNLRKVMKSGVHIFYARTVHHGPLLAYAPLVPRPPADIPVAMAPAPAEALAYAAEEPVQMALRHVPMPRMRPAEAKAPVEAQPPKAAPVVAQADTESSFFNRFDAIGGRNHD